MLSNSLLSGMWLHDFPTEVKNGNERNPTKVTQGSVNTHKELVRRTNKSWTSPPPPPISPLLPPPSSQNTNAHSALAAA